MNTQIAPVIRPLLEERLRGLKLVLQTVELTQAECQVLADAYRRDVAHLEGEIAEMQRQLA